jgi:hypothetical protein
MFRQIKKLRLRFLPHRDIGGFHIGSHRISCKIYVNLCENLLCLHVVKSLKQQLYSKKILTLFWVLAKIRFFAASTNIEFFIYGFTDFTNLTDSIKVVIIR